MIASPVANNKNSMLRGVFGK